MEILNLNVGVLGHVDSGKTSLVKVLSTIASTAAFDKNPQSQERGITIDLGFSSFTVSMPEHLRGGTSCTKIQFTLVDCPGHASLIKTIIGGAQIIDMMILVIDVTKGMQTQTAECLVIGEITCKKMIVVLNKTDLLADGQRAYCIDKMTRKLKLTLKNTVFKDSPVVAVAAKRGGSGDPSFESEGIDHLIETLRTEAFLPSREALKPFLFAADHCFSIRGQGTVLTGTVLQGQINVNDVIEIPALQVIKKVKSLQMFRKPVNSVQQGDRAGVCVTQFDPKLFERGVAAAPHLVTSAYAVLISIKKIKYFKGQILSKSRFHVTMGHDTVMAKITIFGLMKSDYPDAEENALESYVDVNLYYKYLDELVMLDGNGDEGNYQPLPARQYALLEFDKQISVVPGCLVIGSKLDIDFHVNTCRLAFFGCLLEALDNKDYIVSQLSNIKVYKDKMKQGIVERAPNSNEVIIKKLLKKETNMQLFAGLRVELSTGETGIIEGGFGQSGKVKVRIPEGLSPTALSHLGGTSKKKGKNANAEGETNSQPITVTLNFRRLIYDPSKKMVQLKSVITTNH